MPLKFLLLFFAATGIICLSFAFKRHHSGAELLFHTQMSAVIADLKSFQVSAISKESLTGLKRDFVKARLSYKRSSVLADYFFPILRKSINGPDIKYSEEDNPDMIIEPHGFQVIERMLYGSFGDSSYPSLLREIQLLSAGFSGMNEQPGLDYTFRNELIFEALRSADIRLVALGITGFDSPLSLNSMEESIAALEGMKEILSLYKDVVSRKLIEDAQHFLSSSKNFDAFDRMTFIRSYADPLYASIVKTGISSGYLLPDEKRPVSQKSKSIFSRDFLDINFFSPNQRYRMTPERVSLGKSLFYDPILSISNTRSCATCHQPALAFTDGLKVPIGTSDSILLKRNTPTLLGAVFQTRFFYDSRASTLENQLNSVVHNADEMNGSLEQGILRIKKHDRYSNLFLKAYPNDNEPVTQYNIANAISSYIRSLPTGDSKFDRYMRGEGPYNKSETEGFNLFSGKAKCATCHYLPLFNGLVPPQFTETESEVLGVPKKSASGTFQPDDDAGKYLFTLSAINRNAFKTPTLRNISRTAPYMHNGVFGSLSEVMDFYNKGGGAGLHIAPENQTLPPDELHLSNKEIKKIIAFLNTLSDIQSN